MGDSENVSIVVSAMVEVSVIHLYGMTRIEPFLKEVKEARTHGLSKIQKQ